jgi:hypothetical protein
MICLGAAGDDVIENTKMHHNVIYPTRTGGDVRPVRSTQGTVKDFYFYENFMDNDEPAGNYSDAVRLNTIAGEIFIEDNYCDWNSNNWGYFLGNTANSATLIRVVNNFLGATDDNNYASGVSIRNLPASGTKIIIEYNTFYQVSGTNVQLNATADVATEDPTTISVQYNKYIFGNQTGTTAISFSNATFQGQTTFDYVYSDVTLNTSSKPGLTPILPEHVYATEEEVPEAPVVYRDPVLEFTECKKNTYAGAASNVYYSDPACVATAWLYYTKIVLVEKDGHLEVSEIVAAGTAKPATYAYLITGCDASQKDHPEYFEGVEVGMVAVVDETNNTVSFYNAK